MLSDERIPSRRSATSIVPRSCPVLTRASERSILSSPPARFRLRGRGSLKRFARSFRKRWLASSGDGHCEKYRPSRDHRDHVGTCRHLRFGAVRDDPAEWQADDKATNNPINQKIFHCFLPPTPARAAGLKAYSPLPSPFPLSTETVGVVILLSVSGRFAITSVTPLRNIPLRNEL